MRKSLLFLLLAFAAVGYSQELPADLDAPAKGTGPSALSATRAESKLNEEVLHKTVLSYSLPPEITVIMPKCIQGDIDACYFSLKTYEDSTDNPFLAARANLELAFLALQKGQLKQALSHISRASELAPEDPFVELTRGWIFLAAGKYKKARQSFAQLLYLTADFEYVSSSKLGTALSYYLSGKKAEATQALQYLYTSNPYTISFVSYLLGRISAERKDMRHLAPVFLQQALSHDEKNYAAAELFARLTEQEKNPLRAWQYYATLYSLDPQNKILAKKMEKYAPQVGTRQTDYLFYLRLEQPIVHEMISTPSEQVRMALYANRDQVPQQLQSVSVVGSGSLRVKEEKLGEVLRIPSYIEKTIEYNPQTGGVDLKNAKGHVEFSARRPFTITLDNPNRTLLVNKLRAENAFVADLSDKELKGSLIVVPEEDGFLLINEVYAEDLIPALLATRVQDISQPEALKALAVVLRAALKQAVADDKDRPYHITDNDEQFTFRGINLVFKALLDASKSSTQISLTSPQIGAYDNCGPVAARAIQNTAMLPDYVFSPANVSKYVLSNPPSDLYAKPHDPTQWARLKWIYLYDAQTIEDRIAYKQEIGRLRAIIPLQRTPNGRILSMRFEGTKGSYEATSAQEVEFLLSAGTMRSNFFDILPLYKGKNIKQVLVRGYDTGLGEGLCIHGAQGIAKQGADYMAIIKYYFPEARILNSQTGQVQ